MSRFKQVLASKRIKLFAVIDHSGEARAAGLELRETQVVIFGSPAAGTPVMEAVPLAALDLPLKVLVWADEDQARVSYARPASLAARYGLGADLALDIEQIGIDLERAPDHVGLEHPVAIDDRQDDGLGRIDNTRLKRLEHVRVDVKRPVRRKSL